VSPKFIDDWREKQEAEAEEGERPDPVEVAEASMRMSTATDSTFEAPKEDVLVVPGTVEGWRAWKIDLEPPPFGLPPKIYSAVWDYYWTPRKVSRAVCSKNDGHIPGEHCTCGFYSAKTLQQLKGMSYSMYDASTGQVRVIGRVANWGKVVEGSQGWRAEKAYPIQFFLPFEAHRLATPLTEAYGVPVKLMNILDNGIKP
jgi:hypothetical protein